MRAGFSKVDITTYEPDMAMLGWGQIDNRVQGVHTRLSARVLVLQNDDRRLVMLTAELAFITLALRKAVLRELESDGIGEDDLLLSATHTHSGPSGFSHYLAYNVSNYGYSPLVFHTLVERFVGGIRRALEQLEPAECRWGQATIPFSEPVAFNRSVTAYNRNPDVAAVATRRPADATDRVTSTLRVDAEDGTPLGLVNWFGVHGTSVHADNHLIHPDNKGEAAAEVEAAMPEGFVALFAQEAAGDVSPNHRFDARRGMYVGPHDDDFENARAHGQLQAKYALRAWARAGRSAPLRPTLTGRTRYVDLAQGRPIVMGLPMAAGTAEGPGPLRSLAAGLSAASRLRRRLGARDARLPWISLERGAEGRFLGLVPMRLGFELVAPVEPMIAFVRAADRHGWVGDYPWVPPVVPVQSWRIGALSIGALPVEPSTVAGRRLRHALEQASTGPTVLTTYANAYAGYVTTPEEFQQQRYEGGASYFGAEALGVLQGELLRVSQGRAGEAPQPEPVMIDEAFLVAQREAGRSGVGHEDGTRGASDGAFDRSPRPPRETSGSPREIRRPEVVVARPGYENEPDAPSRPQLPAGSPDAERGRVAVGARPGRPAADPGERADARLRGVAGRA